VSMIELVLAFNVSLLSAMFCSIIFCVPDFFAL
jgi:hypothetical protein